MYIFIISLQKGKNSSTMQKDNIGIVILLFFKACIQICSKYLKKCTRHNLRKVRYYLLSSASSHIVSTHLFRVSGFDSSIWRNEIYENVSLKWHNYY